MSIACNIASLVFAFLCFSGVSTGAQYTLSCDFEDGLCGFTNDGGDNLDWDRKSDSTTGQFLSLSSTRQSSDQTSRISSPNMVQFSMKICLEFSYSTNDTTGILNVYKKTDVDEKMVWSTNTSSGNQWKHILVDLHNVTEDYEIIFEGKIQASSRIWIKVDNISLLNGSCFEKFLCDFEDSFCMTQDTENDDFDWRLRSGYTPSYDTGPTNDHTFGTSEGHYAYIEAYYSYYYYSSYYYYYGYQTSQTRTARLITPLLRSSSEVQDRCLIFWYHMYGISIDKLNVYLLPNGESIESEIFNKSDNGGNVWKTAHVTITEQNNFKIIFEASDDRNGNNGDIAVDDISIVFQKCVIGFQCDFDHESCVEQDTSNDDKDWNIGRLWSWRSGTFYDHTSATYSGKYAYLDANYFHLNEIAIFSTPLLTSEMGDKLCLRFWYRVKGENSGKMLVSLANSENTPGRLLWHKYTNEYTDVWREIDIFFSPYDNYKIVFQAEGGTGTEGYHAIDDIEIRNELCVSQEEFNCTFEGEFCLQKGGSSDSYVWSLHSRSDAYNEGPFFDHTIGDEQGHYAFIDAHEWNGLNDSAIMLTPLIHNIEEGDTKCLIFWYHMYGIHIESLEVYLVSMLEDLPGTLAWNRLGNRGNVWRAAEVELTQRNSFQVVFRSVRGGGIDGDIGVDDIIIKNGSCYNSDTNAVFDVTCQFEEAHLCGYTQASNNDFNWTWTNSALGTKHEAPGVPEFDHTTSTGLGFYVLADFRQSKLIRHRARLQSPISNDTSLQCLEFWTFIHGTTSQEVRVLLNQTNSIEMKLCIKGNRGPFWQRSATEFSPTDKYSIIFEALSGVTPVGGISIDDVKITRGNCETVPTSPAPGPKTVMEADCDFETNDLCGYIQDIDDDFDWSLQSAAEMKAKYGSYWWYRWWGAGHEWYPHSDMSCPNSNKGTFLFTDVWEVHYWYWYRTIEHNDKTRIFSPLIEKTETETCLEFWFYKQNSGSEFINVYMLQHNELIYGDPLLALYGSYGNRWILQQVALPTSSKPFQIIFEALSGQSYYTSNFIDEIDYIRSPCTKGDIVCDFEDGIDACRFSNDHHEFKWQLSRGYTATYGTGPSTDHTYGNDTGLYVYIDSSQPQVQSDTASLSTNYWNDIQRDTCLTFWYYCNSTLSGNLIVYQHTKNRKTFLWQMPRLFESRWSEVRIQLPPANESYQIVFTGEVGSSALGDIALDDIALSTSPCTMSSNSPPIDGTSPNSPVQRYDCDIGGDDPKCNILQLQSDQFDWSYSEKNISYLFSSSVNRYTGQKAQFRTPRFNGKDQQCLQITYKTTGVFVPKFNVLKVESTSKMSSLWSTNTITDEWETKWITIQPSSSNYNMIFEATVTKGGNGTVHIKKLNLSSRKCSNNSSSNKVLATAVVTVTLLIALVIFVAISLSVYRRRKSMAASFSLQSNVHHTTLTEDISIDNAQ